MDDPFVERLRRALAPDFEVERVLGAGGMGIVVLAREVSLGRHVAIKTIKPEYATAVAAARFLREAQALASLGHPNIVPIHRFGTTRDGISFIVMEYLTGETLEQRIARGSLSQHEVAGLGRDILSALEAAHERGIIHRDIKPSNIFLSPGRAVLADFGIAKVAGSDEEKITRRGEAPGTPAYAAPEQGGEAEPATDLWSLAAVLYEALTGRIWRASNPVEDPVAGNWVGVPRPLRVALQRALAYMPEDRWPDAASFRQALSGRGGSRWGPWVGGAAAAGLIAYLLWPPQPPPPLPPAIPDLAIVPFRSAEISDPRLGVDLARMVHEIVHNFERVSVAPMGRDTVVPSAAHVVRGVAALEGDTVVVQVSVRDSLERELWQDRVFGPSGTVSERWSVAQRTALGIIHAARPEIRELPGECEPKVVEALEAWLDGEDAFARDDWAGAETYFETAMVLDAEFCIPVFHLLLARRWNRKPITPDLRRALEQYRDRLPLGEQRLLDAELERNPEERRRKYAQAVRADPFSGYAALQFGSDLFHRGALGGIPLDSAATLLREAIARNASLSPAHDQLVWTLVRLGRRAAAESALAALVHNVSHPAERVVPAGLFHLVYLARFAPESAAALLGGGGGAPSGEVFKYVRWGLGFDLAPVQALIGHALTSADDVPLRARGYVARGLARLARGQPLAGLADLDTAGALDPAFALQAAQWRALAPHLGIPGVPDSAVLSGRRRLGALAPPFASGRSAWTLGVVAGLAGDAAALQRHVARLAPGDSALRVLLRGLQVARAGPRDGLQETERLRGAAEEQNRLGDPFARAILHLQRAGWFAAVGDTAAAERELRWHENADFEHWLQGEIQSAEVDWVAGAYVRVREGMRRIGSGDLTACADLRRVVDTLWISAEPGVDPLKHAGQATARGCP